MTTLSRVAVIARKVIRYGVYLTILIIVGRLLYNFGYGIYRQFFPPAEPEPTLVLGDVLPTLPFPEKTVPQNLTYKLETQDGKLPDLPKQALVYAMNPISPNIQALDIAKDKAQKLGFLPDGKKIVENVPNVYVFKKEEEPSSLTMNIVNGAFSISYDLNSNPTVISTIPPSPDAAEQNAISYLKSAQLLPSDLTGPTTHVFYKVQNGNFVPVVSLSESDLIKINLFRKNIDKDYPSLTPEYPNESNVWFMMSGAGRFSDAKIIAAEYHYFTVNEEKSGTYPLKTADEAWENLKSGNSYIVNIKDPNQNEITIRKIYLAYYDAGQYMDFYQPIIVFEGDNDFVSYVPAVSSKHYGATNTDAGGTETPPPSE